MAITSAQDSVHRQNNANAAVIAVRDLLDAMNRLNALAVGRSKFVNPFVDSDFTGGGLSHINAAMMGSLYDFTVNSATGIMAWYADAANGGRNQQNLEQIKA